MFSPYACATLVEYQGRQARKNPQLGMPACAELRHTTFSQLLQTELASEEAERVQGGGREGEGHGSGMIQDGDLTATTHMGCRDRIPWQKRAFQDRIWSLICVQMLSYGVSACFYIGFVRRNRAQ